MLATMDQAGRVVIPRQIRQDAGLRPGPVDITLAGNAVLIEVPTSDLVERNGRLMLPSGAGLSGDELRAFRLADQR
jgi:bifunctional DNA-binding transcriptional regulator/antitoxin component of YhaV-PrlF toxin-antitoxin module